MYEPPWYDQDLEQAASNAAQRFDLDDDQARGLVEMVVDALEEGGDAVGDAAWDVENEHPGVPGEDFIEDVAADLGYEDLL